MMFYISGNPRENHKEIKRKENIMDFEKLVSNLQEEQKMIESQVLSYCNPQQIAREIMEKLEKASPLGQDRVVSTGYPAKAGSLSTTYELWDIRKPDQLDSKGKSNGPLSKCNDRGKLSHIVLDLVKKYINDDIVKLGLEPMNGDGYSMMDIYASISKEDIEYLKSLTPAERAERKNKS